MENQWTGIVSRCLGLYLIVVLSAASNGWAASPRGCAESLDSATTVVGEASPLTQLIDAITADLAGRLDVPASSLTSMMNQPKNPEHGDYALPLFGIAKGRGLNPQEFAMQIADQINAQPAGIVSQAFALNGFLNFKVSARPLIEALKQAGIGSANFGWNQSQKGKTVVIDFASPNVAKPLHVGHLRSAVIGQALKNIAETQGYKTIGVNYWGDWGVNFGLLAWAYQTWGSEYDLANDAFESLYKMYVRVRDATKNPEGNPDAIRIKSEGDALFKKMEDGDPELLALWAKFVEITKTEDQKLYQMFGIHHDLDRGESHYNSHIPGVLQRLREMGLLRESDGAQVVDVDGIKHPVLLVNSNGVSLYAARDVAAGIDRVENLGGDELIYVVGADQKSHFQQVFGVLKKMGYPWANHLSHVDFGLVTLDGKKLSSRDGGAPRLDGLVKEAIESIHATLLQHGIDDPKLAQQIAVGALVFNDLVTDRVKDSEFNIEKFRNFETGGPLLQKTVLRARAVVTEAERLPGAEGELESKGEKDLLKLLLNYPTILQKSYQEKKPSVLAQYLLQLGQLVSLELHNHSSSGSPTKLTADQAWLLASAATTLEQGLGLLGVKVPDRTW